MQYVGRAPFSPGRRAMFWEPARGRHAARLGQAAYKDPSNRLLEQPLISILKRRLLAVLGGKTFLKDAGWPGHVDMAAVGRWFENFWFPTYVADAGRPIKSLVAEQIPEFPYPSSIPAFFDVSQDSTSQELDDADQIDAYFGPSVDIMQGVPVPSRELESQLIGSSYHYQDPWITQPCLDGYFYPGAKYGMFQEFSSSRTSPKGPGSGLGEKVDMAGRFWCSPWAKGNVSEAIPDAVRYAWPPGGVPGTSNAPGGSARAYFWGLTLNEPWGDVKPWMKNAELAEYVLARYPFPQPFNSDGYQRFWSYFALPGLQALVKTGVNLAEEDIRVWITFSIIAHFNEMADALNSYFESQAHSMKQSQTALIIGAAVVAVFAAIILVGAPVIASLVAGVANSAATAMNKIDQHKFQVEMADIQDAFKESDPAFSDQVGEAAAYVQRLSAALETAVDKENVTRTLSSPGLSTGLLIGGGLAAIGALALAIFRK